MLVRRCQSCRVTHLSPVSKTNGRRNVSSKIEPYILPRLAIDLDANDSPYVRKFSPERDFTNYPERIVSPRDLRERWKKVWREESESSKPPAGQDVFDHAFSAPDLLSFILEGDPRVRTKDSIEDKTARASLSLKMSSHGIDLEDTAECKIRQMIESFEEIRSEPDNQLRFSRKQLSILWRELQTWPSNFPSRFHRAVALLAASDEGCKLLADNGSAIARGLGRCRHDQQLDGTFRIGDVVRFLNDLCHKLQSKDLQFNSYLCAAAIYYATKAFNLSALKLYIRLARDIRLVVWPRSMPAKQILFAASMLKFVLANSAKYKILGTHQARIEVRALLRELMNLDAMKELKKQGEAPMKVVLRPRRTNAKNKHLAYFRGRFRNPTAGTLRRRRGRARERARMMELKLKPIFPSQS